MVFGRHNLLGLVVLLGSPAALAGPAFVSGASVERDGNSASITVLLACHVRYLEHTPTSRATVFRIQLESTNSCNGVSPAVANTQEYYLPTRADEAKLTSIEYDGTSPGHQVLTLSFSKVVSLSVVADSVNDRVRVNVDVDASAIQPTASRQTEPVQPAASTATPGTTSHLVQRPDPKMPVFVINLGSSRRPPATADSPDLVMAEEHKVYFTTVQLDGETWYRIRLGFFDSKESAAAQLETVKKKYPASCFLSTSVINSGLKNCATKRST